MPTRVANPKGEALLVTPSDPREDFGQMFLSSLGTHIYFKSCLMVSVQSGAESCDAESGLASNCSGLEIHLTRNLCSTAQTMPDQLPVVAADT